MDDLFVKFVERAMRPAAPPPEPPPPPEPTENVSKRRSILRVANVAPLDVERVTLEEARDHIARAMRDYLAEPDPEHMLLIKAPPGVGKSWAAVRLAEEFAAPHGKKGKRRRVLYAGPRHDLFETIVRMSENPFDWYEWLPRQSGNEEGTKVETCRYVPEISTWMNRGYPAMEFCKGCCGWDYINSECVYHAQKKRPEPIIYGMHQHVFTGHPLPFHLLIGDEYPVGAAMHQWVIAGEDVASAERDPFDRTPAADLMYRLRTIVTSGASVEGPELLDMLGGAEHVKRTLENAHIDPTGTLLMPEIHQPEQAALAPYGHIMSLAPLLLRECEWAIKGKPYLARVIVANGNLQLLLRKRPNEKLPRHVIWLDATGNEHIYETVFGRPVQTVEPNVERVGTVYQVYDRANGKGSLVDSATGGTTDRVEQLKSVVDFIVREKGYKRPGIYTFKAIEEKFDLYKRGHFGAETGSNDFEDVDALFIAGTPLPSHYDLETTARMIFFERMEPFNDFWSAQPVVYVNQVIGDDSAAYPVGNFWGDADLAAVVWQTREARIIQAAERARLNVLPNDVILLTNVPVRELPPDVLISVRALFGAPPSIDPYRWPEFLMLADKHFGLGAPLTSSAIAKHMGLSAPSARKWLDLLAEAQPDRWAYPPPDYLLPKSRGKPPKTVIPLT
jgi:DNA polymerase III delta prime subunit